MEDDLIAFNDAGAKPGMRHVLPANFYNAWAERFEFRATKKDPAAKMLVVYFVIIDGEYCRQRIVDRMVLFSPLSPEAEFLGQARLRTFAHAAIGRQAKSTDELLFKPVVLSVRRKKSEEYGESNQIYDYIKAPPGILLELRRQVCPGLDHERAAILQTPQMTPVDATGDGPAPEMPESAETTADSPALAESTPNRINSPNPINCPIPPEVSAAADAARQRSTTPAPRPPARTSRKPSPDPMDCPIPPAVCVAAVTARRTSAMDSKPPARAPRKPPTAAKSELLSENDGSGD
jgi:hypothetical protein